MRFRNFIRKYFTFNTRERNGLIVLFSLIILLIISAIYLRSQKSNINLSIELPEVDSTYQLSGNKKKYSSIKKQKPAQKQLMFFVFDPNTISEEQAEQLGFSNKAARVLMNFRKKGGVFKEKTDLKKIFGVSDKLFTRLEPYILIEKTENTSTTKKTDLFPKKTNEKKILELNTADSSQLVGLNGIGPKLSSRILSYRKSLGGFVNVVQLKEIYGMKDSLYNLFADHVIVNPDNIKKIKINTITIDELKKHVYIKYMIAQSIINYRQKHGNFANEQDLIKVGSLNEELINKLKPYIDYN